jgi:hypothetical protein
MDADGTRASRRWLIAIGAGVAVLAICLTVSAVGLLIARGRASRSEVTATGTFESARVLTTSTSTQPSPGPSATAIATGLDSPATPEGFERPPATQTPTQTLTPHPPSPTATHTPTPTVTPSPTPYAHFTCTQLDHFAGAFVGDEFRFHRSLKNDGTLVGDGEFTFGYAENPGFAVISSIQQNAMQPGVNYLSTLVWTPADAGTYDLYIKPSEAASYDSPDSCHEQVTVQLKIVIITKAP